MMRPNELTNGQTRPITISPGEGNGGTFVQVSETPREDCVHEGVGHTKSISRPGQARPVYRSPSDAARWAKMRRKRVIRNVNHSDLTLTFLTV